jgi:hypothetical protein
MFGRASPRRDVPPRRGWPVLPAHAANDCLIAENCLVNTRSAHGFAKAWIQGDNEYVIFLNSLDNVKVIDNDLGNNL